MAEYIEREQTLKRLLDGCACRGYNGLTPMDVKKEIASIPSADVKPVVHGHWVMEEYDYPCSVCGETVDYEYDVRVLKYCPNFGAKMEADNG